jgi:hypothetical protein
MNLQNSISTCLIQPYFEIGATPIWEKNPVRHSVFVDRTSPSIDPKWLKNMWNCPILRKLLPLVIKITVPSHSLPTAIAM